jgi:dTDP-4-dehydrorhamnose reductase
MKIVVLGAEGQVGRELMLLPPPPGVECVGYGRAAADITDPVALASLMKADKPNVVVNTAAYTAVDKAESERDAAFLVNARGARNVAMACMRAGAVAIQISTDYVFDGSSPVPYRETDPTNSQSVYGASKTAGEDEVRNALAQHIIIRTSWVFGRYGHNFVKTVMRLAGEREQLRMIDDQRSCPTSARDLAKAILKIATMLDSGDAFGTYHFANAGPVSWYEFARVIVDLAIDTAEQRPEVMAITTNDYAQAAIRPRYSVLDCKRIGQQFSIVPPSWRPALAEVVEQVKSGEGL